MSANEDKLLLRLMRESGLNSSDSDDPNNYSDSSGTDWVPDAPKRCNRMLSSLTGHGQGVTSSASMAIEHDRASTSSTNSDIDLGDVSTSSVLVETRSKNDQNNVILNWETGFLEEVTEQGNEGLHRELNVNSITGLLEVKPAESDGETDVVVSTKKGKKRKHQPGSWKRNKKKKTNLTKHEMRPIPHCRCKCTNKIRPCEAKYIFDKFIKLGSHTEQNIYLQGCISEVTPKRFRPRRRLSPSKITNRLFKYSVRYRKKTIEVCQNAFLSIHGIQRDRLQAKVQHPEKDIHDGRGKHSNHKTYNIETITKVNKFINELPARVSHYSRSSNKHKKFLDSNLTIADLHRKYTETHPNNTITYEKFRQIFNIDHNIAFGQPRKDICSTCEKTKIQIDAATLNKDAVEKRNLIVSKEIHLRKAEVFLNKLSMIENSKDDTKLSICMDYQKNLPLPVTNISDEYYLRQLWLHNFGIHNLRNNTATMYLYTEQYAHKGPNEVISALDDYIANNQTPTQTHLEIFCDNCYSQNKNRFLFTYLDQLCAKGDFQTISVQYPIPGHSMMAIDRDFALIERKRLKTDKIFTPDYYINLIQNSKNKNKNDIVFIEKNLSSDMTGRTIKVKDYKTLYDEKIKQSLPGISLCRQVRLHKNSRAEMSDSMTSTILKPFQLYRTGVNRLIRDEPVNCYNSPLKIKPEKAKDVAKLLQYIPEGLRHHYDDIFVTNTDSPIIIEDSIDEVE